MIPADWRYFDNGGRTMDRYSVWEGDGYLGMSEHPFHPQGFGQHCEGMHPDYLLSERDDNPLGREITFSDLPPDCQKAVMQDASYAE